MEPINNQLLIKLEAGASAPENGSTTPSESFARVMAARERPENRGELAARPDREGSGSVESRDQALSISETLDPGAPPAIGSEPGGAGPLDDRCSPVEGEKEIGATGEDLERAVLLTAGIHGLVTNPAVRVPPGAMDLLNPESMIDWGDRPIGAEISGPLPKGPESLSLEFSKTAGPDPAGFRGNAGSEPSRAGLPFYGPSMEASAASSTGGTFKPGVDQVEARVAEPSGGNLFRPAEAAAPGGKALHKPDVPTNGVVPQEEGAGLQEKSPALPTGKVLGPRGLPSRNEIKGNLPTAAEGPAVADTLAGGGEPALVSKTSRLPSAAEGAEPLPQGSGIQKTTLILDASGLPRPVQTVKTETTATFGKNGREGSSPAFPGMASDPAGSETPAGSPFPGDRSVRTSDFSDRFVPADGDSEKNRPAAADPAGFVFSEETPNSDPKAAREILEAGRRETLSGAASTETVEKGLKDKGTTGLPVFEQVNRVVLRGLTQRENRILLTLDPPELGSLVIEITRDRNQVSAQLWTDTPQTKEMLDFSQRQLQQTLEQEGFKLNRFQVQIEPDLKSFQDNRWFGGRQPSGEERPPGSRGEAAPGPDLPAAETVRRLFSRGNQLVDTWA